MRMELIEQKWDEILLKVKEEHELTDVSFNTWLKPLEVYSVQNERVYILVSSEQMGLSYIKKKYYLPLKVAIAEVTGIEYEVEFVLPDQAKKLTMHHPRKTPTTEEAERSNLNPNYTFDTFVVGSDQVWNASMLNRRYFLDYVKAGRIKAAYCPSMGSGTVLKQQRKVFKRYLESFNYIATRELKLKEILTLLLKQPVEHLLDPSMLYPREEYLKMAHLPELFEAGKYLLCYFLPKNDFQAEQARRFAKERGLKLVVMAMFPYSFTVKDAEIYAAAGPKEFVGLIANAAVVFSSSFHCTIFSIMLHKDLYVFEQSFTSKTADTNQRYTEQLETYGITHRYIRWGDEITEKNRMPINYEKVEKIFQERIRRSYAFLNQFS